MQKPCGDQEHELFKEMEIGQCGLRGRGRSDPGAADKAGSVQLLEECLPLHSAMS